MINLYILKTRSKNADGSPLTGFYKGINWYKGYSRNVYNSIEANRLRSVGAANEVVLFAKLEEKIIDNWIDTGNLKIGCGRKKK